MPRPENIDHSLTPPVIRGTFMEPLMRVQLESAEDAVTLADKIVGARTRHEELLTSIGTITRSLYLGLFALSESRLAQLLEHEKPIKEGKKGKRKLVWSSDRKFPNLIASSDCEPEFTTLRDRFGLRIRTANNGSIGERVDAIQGFTMLTTDMRAHYGDRYRIDISVENDEIAAIDYRIHNAGRILCSNLAESYEPYKIAENRLDQLNNDRGKYLMRFILGEIPELYLLIPRAKRRLPGTFRFKESSSNIYNSPRENLGICV